MPSRNGSASGLGIQLTPPQKVRTNMTYKIKVQQGKADTDTMRMDILNEMTATKVSLEKADTDTGIIKGKVAEKEWTTSRWLNRRRTRAGLDLT